MKEQFARSLRESLRVRYGKVPSAAVVARDFNLRAYGVAPITQESARRWMRGESFPSPKYLGILISWLGVSLDPAILTPQRQTHTSTANGEPAAYYISPMPASDERIIRLFASLNPEQKIAVVKLIETCFLDRSEGYRRTLKGRNLKCWRTDLLEK